MKKSFGFSILFLFVINATIASQSIDALFSQDLTSYNPSYVGMYTKPNIAFRTQTTYFKNSENEIETRGSSGKFIFNVPIKKVFSGIGFSGNYEESNYFGFSSNLNLNLCYSFTYEINKNIEFSIGPAIRFYRTKYEMNYLPDQWDVVYPGGGQYSSNPTSNPPDYKYLSNDFYFDAGVWAKLYNVQIGCTGENLNNEEDWDINTIIQYNKKLNDKFQFEHSLLIYNLRYIIDQYGLRYRVDNVFTIQKSYELGISTNTRTGVTIHNPDFNSPYLDFAPIFGFKFSDRFRLLIAFELCEYINKELMFKYDGHSRYIIGSLRANF